MPLPPWVADYTTDFVAASGAQLVLACDRSSSSSAAEAGPAAGARAAAGATARTALGQLSDCSRIGVNPLRFSSCFSSPHRRIYESDYDLVTTTSDREDACRTLPIRRSSLQVPTQCSSVATAVAMFSRLAWLVSAKDSFPGYRTIAETEQLSEGSVTSRSSSR